MSCLMFPIWPFLLFNLFFKCVEYECKIPPPSPDTLFLFNINLIFYPNRRPTSSADGHFHYFWVDPNMSVTLRVYKWNQMDPYKSVTQSVLMKPNVPLQVCNSLSVKWTLLFVGL